MDFNKTAVLVVIPTLNEVCYIESVMEQLMSGLNDDVLVKFAICDGGSKDGTVAVAQCIAEKHKNVEYIHNPKRLQSAAVNQAVKVFGLGHHILVRCDAHAIYPFGYIINLVRSLENSGADSVVVPMDSVGNGCLQRAIGWATDTAIGSGGAVHRGGKKSGFVDHGHHAAFKMDMFIKSGGYDESFSHNEDGEFDCRQRCYGARIYFDSSIRIGYFPRNSFKSLWRQYLAYGNGRSRTVRRHPSSLRMRQVVVPLNLMMIIAGLILFLEFPWMLTWFISYICVLAVFGVFLAVRHKSICGLLAVPALLTMHTAWGCGFLWGILKNKDKRFKIDL